MDRTLFIWLFASGALAGLGRFLLTGGTLKVAIGRAITSGMLGMAAATALVWWPNLPQEALVGIAAGLGSLGTTGVERIVSRYTR